MNVVKKSYKSKKISLQVKEAQELSKQVKVMKAELSMCEDDEDEDEDEED